MGKVLKVGRKPTFLNPRTVARFDSLPWYSESEMKIREGEKIICRGEIIGMMLAISKLMLTFVVLNNHQGEVAR